MFIGCARAGAACFFIDGEQQTDLGYTVSAQLLSGRDLSSDDAFCIAGSAAMDIILVFCRGDMRWHGVHMGRKDYARWPGCRSDDIGATFRDCLDLNLVVQALEVRIEKATDAQLFAGSRGNIYEISSQFGQVHAPTASLRDSPSLSKKASCSRESASRTLCSSTTKVRLILDAP